MSTVSELIVTLQEQCNRNGRLNELNELADWAIEQPLEVKAAITGYVINRLHVLTDNKT